MMKLDNALYSYKQIKDKLLKYKKEYEEEIDRCIPMYPKGELIAKGHLRMLDILLDDLDSNSGIGWLGIDLTKDEEITR